MSIRVGAPDGPSLGDAAVTAARAAGHGRGLRLPPAQRGRLGTNTVTIYVVSSGGGVAGAFRVTNA